MPTGADQPSMRTRKVLSLTGGRPDFNRLNEEVAIIVEESTTPIIQSESLPQLQVQITYLAGESSADLVEERTRVGKLWDRARQIKPGEMLASIRETKNDFFNAKKN